MSFDSFMKGVQRADAEFETKRKRENEAEDRKLAMARLKLQDLEAKRKEAIENAALMQGQPARRQDAPNFPLPQLPESIIGPVGTQTAPLQQQLPHDPIPIPAAHGELSIVKQPQTMEELIRRQREQQIFEAQLRAETPTPRNIDPLSPEGIKARAELEKLTRDQPGTRNIDPLSPEGIKAAVERARLMPQRPLAPIVVQTPSGPQVVDRGSRTAEPIKSGGEVVPLVPTAEQRNRQAAFKNTDVILTGISELSEKINTGVGIIAKASGEIEKAKARANYNDDVAEYEALISGFTPMIARAVGHTGVLTEQDVQSVKAMFPRPGDSKTLRDRKIARIKTILQGVQAAAGTAGAQLSEALIQANMKANPGMTREQVIQELSK